MKKTIGLIILFLALATVSWVLMNKEKGTQIVNSIDKDFTIEKIAQVDKIFIADRSGHKPSILQKKGDHWVFDGKYKAREGAVNLLLDAIKRMRVKQLVPESAMERITYNMASEGIFVQLFDATGEKLKAFYIGGMTNDERGTYMALEGSERPYVMHIPSWDGNLRQRFSLRGDAWRDRAIFAKEVEEISSISMNYPKQKNQSFILNKEGEDYKLVPFYETTPRSKKDLKKGTGESFLVNFKSIAAEAFENYNPQKESIKQTIPFCIIQLKDIHGKENRVELYPVLPKDKYGKVIADGREVERYFASTSDGDLLLVQHRVIKKILWGYQLFFED